MFLHCSAYIVALAGVAAVVAVPACSTEGPQVNLAETSEEAEKSEEACLIQVKSFNTTSQSGWYFKSSGHEYGIAAEGSISFAAAFGDVDGDGDMDLLVTGAGTPNLLYMNSDGKGTFTDLTSDSGLNVGPNSTRGVAFADVNGDGFLDVAMSRDALSMVQLFLGDGTGKFSDVSNQSGVAGIPGLGQGVCFADIDGDGDLDLFVANWGDGMAVQPYAPNALFRNDGHGTFENVANAAGVEDRSKCSFGCVFGDVDNDGDLDLYVTNAGTPNQLFFNNGAGIFTAAPEEAGVGGYPHGQGRGVQMADFNGDSNLDLLAVTVGEAVEIFLGDGSGNFTNGTSEAGVAGPHQALQGVAVADFNGDGSMDILLSGINIPAFLYQNDGTGKFKNVDPPNKATGQGVWGQGIAVADINGDGLLDAYTANWGPYPGLCDPCRSTNLLWMNQLPVPAWLQVKPVTAGGQATLLGAEVRLFEAGTQTPAGVLQQIDGGSGFCSQSAYPAYFGLRGSGAEKFDIELRCRGQRWITKADYPELGGVSPNQTVAARCDATY